MVILTLASLSRVAMDNAQHAARKAASEMRRLSLTPGCSSESNPHDRRLLAGKESCRYVVFSVGNCLRRPHICKKKSALCAAGG